VTTSSALARSAEHFLHGLLCIGMDEGSPNARIAGRDDVHDSLATFRIAPIGGAITPFEPGQFVNVGVSDAASPGTIIRRALSVASSPAEKRHYELLVRRVDDGQFTPRLWEHREGDLVWLDPRVYGKFTLGDVPSDRDVVLVATGTGIGPFLSMLRRYAGTGRWRRLALIHGVREARDLSHRDEIERIRRADPSVAYLPTVSRDAGTEWSGLRGRVQSLLEPERYSELVGAPLEPGRCSVLLCGNPAMIEDVSERLCSRGFRHHTRRGSPLPANGPGQIFRERYW
jgi:ferredoxin/flavodoxin---NADP+ reductase